MGPAVIELFAEAGAEVIAGHGDVRDPGHAESLHAAHGEVDILVANLAASNPKTAAAETGDDDFQAMFQDMVFPLQRLVRTFVPAMIARRRGKIVVMGSASALRGMPNWSAYSAARGAQVSYVRALGIELAPHNVQCNVIAQSFVDNPDYFPPEYKASEEFRRRIAAVPVGRTATGRESALAALFLASAESDFFVGQVFPFSGGWTA